MLGEHQPLDFFVWTCSLYFLSIALVFDKKRCIYLHFEEPKPFVPKWETAYNLSLASGLINLPENSVS